MRQLTAEEFGRLFETCRTAFRLETLQAYDVPEEAEDLAAWREGRPPPPNPWAEFVAQRVAEGATWQRVHAVREPLSQYLRYEMERYKGSVAAGEDVRIVVVVGLHRFGPFRHDWWAFDLDGERPTVALMQYDGHGRWLGAIETTRPDVVKACRADRDMALAISVPLGEYLATAGV